jgi:D-cysteine desulfhydrase
MGSQPVTDHPMSATGLPLFAAYPELETSLPRVVLTSGPSPVRRLSALEEQLGRPDLWLKNDGLLGTMYGGNKIRKLEFILADVLRRRFSTILTFGGTGSHHCLATALYAPELRIRVAAVLVEQPETDEVRENLRQLEQAGARTVRTGGLSSAVVRAAWLILQNTHVGLPPRPPYFLRPGGSTPVGCVGYVNAAFELADQVRQGLLPEPRTIVLPLGSNGTAAGLLLGLRLAELDASVIAVQVSDIPTVGAAGVARLANATARLLRRRGASIPPLSFDPHDLTVISDAKVRRYGHPTPKGEEAKDLLSRLEGLELDSTYTAKTVAALIERDDLPRPLLYWHTLNAHTFPTSA